jgi:hypothetical protein
LQIAKCFNPGDTDDSGFWWMVCALRALRKNHVILLPSPNEIILASAKQFRHTFMAILKSFRGRRYSQCSDTCVSQQLDTDHPGQ